MKRRNGIRLSGLCKNGELRALIVKKNKRVRGWNFKFGACAVSDCDLVAEFWILLKKLECLVGCRQRQLGKWSEH